LVIEQKIGNMLGFCPGCNVQPCQCYHGPPSATSLTDGPAYIGGSTIDTSSIDTSFSTSREKVTAPLEEKKFEPVWGEDEDSW